MTQSHLDNLAEAIDQASITLDSDNLNDRLAVAVREIEDIYRVLEDDLLEGQEQADEQAMQDELSCPRATGRI